MFPRVPDDGVAYWSWAVVDTASGEVVESEDMQHNYTVDVHGRTVTMAYNFKYPCLLNGMSNISYGWFFL